MILAAVQALPDGAELVVPLQPPGTPLCVFLLCQLSAAQQQQQQPLCTTRSCSLRVCALLWPQDLPHACRGQPAGGARELGRRARACSPAQAAEDTGLAGGHGGLASTRRPGNIPGAAPVCSRAASAHRQRTRRGQDIIACIPVCLGLHACCHKHAPSGLAETRQLLQSIHKPRYAGSGLMRFVYGSSNCLSSETPGAAAAAAGAAAMGQCSKDVWRALPATAGGRGGCGKDER